MRRLRAVAVVFMLAGLTLGAHSPQEDTQTTSTVPVQDNFSLYAGVTRVLVDTPTIEPVEEVKSLCANPVEAQEETEEGEATEEVDRITYYEISEAYIANGGELTHELQDHIHAESGKAGIDPYIVIATIERESGYRASLSELCKGLMQVYEKYNRDIMQDKGVTDLLDPYQNTTVGIELLGRYYNKYGDYHLALMCYNCGENKAKSLWKSGKYSSAYSRKIIQRAEEIRQEVGGSYGD